MTSLPSRRRQLEQERLNLQDRLRRIRADRSRSNGPVDADFAEQAVERENDEVLEQLDSVTLTELGKVEHALSHLAKGRGNRCECCGKTISRKRLAAMIHAPQCETCAHDLSTGASDAARGSLTSA